MPQLVGCLRADAREDDFPFVLYDDGSVIKVGGAAGITELAIETSDVLPSSGMMWPLRAAGGSVGRSRSAVWVDVMVSSLATTTVTGLVATCLLVTLAVTAT